MSFMNRFRRIFPTKQVDVKNLERQSVVAEKPVLNTVPKSQTEQAEVKEASDTEALGMVNGEYEIIEREILPEQIICPDCGGFTMEGLEYCDKCGGDLTGV